MIRTSKAAILVMNKTDSTEDGKVRTRQNVVHELGISQEFLGPEKSITLLEDGCEMPSNLAGITHLPYATGSIYSTKDEVLATLENKFGPGAPDPVE